MDEGLDFIARDAKSPSDAPPEQEGLMNALDIRLNWPEGIVPTAEFAAARDFLTESSGNLFVTGRDGKPRIAAS